MTTHPTIANPVPPDIVKQKLAAFEQLQLEFEVCFQYVQDKHWQRRFTSLSIAEIVRYLHALWVCECKDRLLSIPKTITRYEGRHCLTLLHRWQEGDSADVVAFLQRKLDMLPFADLTRQLQRTRQNRSDDDLAHRLEHGRQVMLNRGIHLMLALDTIFSLPEDALLREVQEACRESGHDPSAIEKQLAEFRDPLYAYIPRQTLAQRNILVMNSIGVHVSSQPADQPGRRSHRVLEPTMPPGPYAQYIIAGYVELTTPLHNNLRGLTFVDRPEQGGV